jgi:[ribosomal protein S5]-alanine N-acetyltransferase
MRTERLHLRPLTFVDASRIADLGGDWDVARMTGRIPYPYSVDAALQWVTGLAAGEQVFAIDYQGQLIGLCGFTLADDCNAEIGYWIGRPHWGEGFATEAARAVIHHGFTKCNIRRFTCSHFTDNPASRRVIQKLGFNETGLSRGWCEARQLELPTTRYERRRPWTAAIKALAS